MKAARLAALAALVSIARPASADDTVRACIASSTDAQTLRQHGKLLEAREQLIACARDACPAIVRSHCARWLGEVEPAIPSVVVRVVHTDGNDAVHARLWVDGHATKLDGQPVRLDPGEHALAAEDERGARTEQHVLLVEGDGPRRVTLRVPDVAVPARSVDVNRSGRTIPLGAWILGGAGVAALGVAAYFGVAAGDQLHQLDTTCSPHCTDSQTQPGRTDALLFDALLGAGAGALAGALVWGLAFPSGGTTTAWTPRFEVRPSTAGIVTTLGVSY